MIKNYNQFINENTNSNMNEYVYLFTTRDGLGGRESSGENVEEAFGKLGYTNFTVVQDKTFYPLYTINIDGNPGHESTYRAKLISGIHNGYKFNSDEVKPGDLTIDVTKDDSEPIEVIEAENGALGFKSKGWFTWIPYREQKHKKVV